MQTGSFDQVAELASQLAPEDQLRLVAEIGERLRHSLAGSQPPGRSVDAILRAAREPPHLEAADVDELEHTITAGRLPVRRTGIFDRGGDG